MGTPCCPQFLGNQGEGRQVLLPLEEFGSQSPPPTMPPRASGRGRGESKVDTERFARLAEGLPYGVTVYKAESDQMHDLRLVWTNGRPSYESRTHLGASVGQRLGDIAPDPLDNAWTRTLAQAWLRVASAQKPEVLEDVPYGGERHPQGWFRVHFVPVGEGYCASVYENVTERRRTLEMLQTKSQALARSNAELEQFAYVASHDLQEPLRMIAAYLNLLVEDHGALLQGEAKEYVGYAVEGAVRMKALIRDLLEHSRVGTRGRPPRPTESSDAFDLAVHDLRGRIDRQHAEVTRDRLPSVLADARQLQQLMNNLIGNSLKFCKGRAPRVHVSASRQGEWWQFQVKDNGIGIDADYFERIFQVFQRLHTRSEYEGTGIGLALCRKIVERHGGEISVQSVLGEGSVFTFTLPAGEHEGAA